MVILHSPAGHINPVVPLIAPDVPDTGGGVGPQLAGKTKGVRLVEDLAFLGADGVFVGVSLMGNADEHLPYPGGANGFHGVCVQVPAIKAAHYAHRSRVGRPHCKTKRRISVLFHPMAA